MKRTRVGVLIVLLLGTIAGAEAFVGQERNSVSIPTAAQCAEDSGTAVAVVPGGKIGSPQIPVLLVTSCTNKLFFLDPANPATPVLTLTTTPGPTTGNWQAITLRADKGDLLACQPVTGGTTLHSIDYSSLNTITDGTVVPVRNGPAGSTCAGLAWDSNDKTIYQTGLSGSQNVVFHFGESATSTATSVLANCPTGDSVTGISVAGTSLFVSCATPVVSLNDEIRQGYKVDNSPGGAVRDVVVATPGSLAYDPVSLGSEFKDAIWTKGPGAQLRAIEWAGGTSGQLVGVPVLFPGACPQLAKYFVVESDIPKDTDGDSLPDCWEDGTLWDDGLPGINYSGVWPEPDANGKFPATLRDVTLCVETNGTSGFQAEECASKTQKDIFVEVDFMQFHRPDPVAIGNVVTAFANAPAPTANQPAYPGPIRLHVQIDEQIPHTTATALIPCTPAPALGDATFDGLKTQFFGTQAERSIPNGTNAKALASHYALFVHNQPGTGNTSSGCSEVGGNDFMVSLGSWGIVTVGGVSHNVGTTDQQAGTFMHELGHNLGLRHGGDSNSNCKPNYQSVMNYTLQFSNTITARPLDYSRLTLATLNEASLVETTGVGAAPAALFTGKVAFGPQAGIPSKAVVATVNADDSIDWNRNGTVSATPVARDLNNLGIASCPALPGTFPANAEILTGFNDWISLDFNFRGSLDFAGGATSSIDENIVEITLPEALSLSRDVIDIKPADPNNTIGRGAATTIEVAMFSRRDDHGLLEFDARNLDPATIVLRGTGNATWTLPVKRNTQGKFQCSMRDVNHDGAADLVCQFDFAKNTVSVGDKSAVLEATTFDGTYDFHASDSIRVMP